MADDVSLLILALGDSDAKRRVEALRRFAQMGEEARPAAVPLVRLTGDEQEEIRQWSAAALEEMGPPAPGDAPMRPSP